MRRLLPLSLTALLALTACQFTGRHDDAGAARRLNSMQALPLAAYLPDPSSDEAKTMSTAEWILAKRCMVRLGFTGFTMLDTKVVVLTYPARQGTLRSGSHVGDYTLYGVDDPERAAGRGYRYKDGEDPEDPTRPREWPADQYVALTGNYEPGDSRTTHGNRIPARGCVGEADRKLYGPPPKARQVGGLRLTSVFSLATQLWFQTHRDAQKDPVWKKADRAWSACMKDKGFTYPSPDEASLDTHWFETDKPSDKEKKTAAADARCKLGTKYIESVHAVDVRLQKRAVAQHKKDLEALSAAADQAVAQAKAIIHSES